MLLLVRFDEAGMKSLGFGHCQRFAQQHSLTDTAQADGHDSSGRATQTCSADGDTQSLQQLLPPAECRGRRAGAWGIRVANRVHYQRVYPILRYFEQ